MLNRTKGQSTLEYIAVFAAIVGAIVILAYTKMKPAVEKVMDSSAAKVTQSATDFSASTGSGN